MPTQQKLKKKRRRLFLMVIGLLIAFSGPAKAEVSYVYVMSSEANIRSGPGTQYEIIATVKFCTMLEVVGKDINKNWLSVRTPEGETGWTDKNSITYLKAISSVLSKKKGMVDFKVAKEQALKWWQTKSSDSTPVCDICNAKVPQNTGYLLTAKQVLSSKVYHELLRTSFPEYYSLMISNFEKDKTPWLICNKCIGKYFMDIPGSSHIKKLEKAMLADKALNENIIKTIKKYYSVKHLKNKVDKNELWLAEDKARGVMYPVTPLMGKEILKLLEERKFVPLPVEEKVTIIGVYDNYRVDPNLTTSWGFGCVIRTPDKNILFDTGGDSSILLSNMEKMKIDPNDINIVVISHIHGDHVGGLNGFLERNRDVKVYIPSSFPNSIREKIKSYGAEYQDVKGSMQISNRIWTTGEMGTWIKEQSLVLDTEKGLVVITGCAHPGVVNIAKKTKQILPHKNIYIVMGGFHLSGASDSKLRSIIKGFRDIGVQKVAPSHCSGDRCRELFKEEYKEDYVESGVGKIIIL